MLEALESGRAYSSLSIYSSGTSDDEDSMELLDYLGKEEGEYELVEQRRFLAPAMGHLDERERLILHLRFFEGMTQTQIAARVGISQMHVSRLIRKSIEQLRHYMLDGGAVVAIGPRGRVREQEGRGTGQAVADAIAADTRTVPPAPKEEVERVKTS